MKLLPVFLVLVTSSNLVMAERPVAEIVGQTGPMPVAEKPEAPTPGGKHTGTAATKDEVGARQAGKSQAAQISEAIGAISDNFDKLTAQGVRMNFGGDIRALKVLKEHLDSADAGKPLPPSLLNWFQNLEERGFEKPTNSDMKGIFDIMTMLVAYQNHLLRLYDGEVDEREKLELNFINEYVSAFDEQAKKDGTIQLEWDDAKKKEILAGFRMIKELRRNMEKQNDSMPNTYSEEIYKIRDQMAGISKKDIEEGFEKLGGVELIKRSNSASEMIFAVYGEINNRQNEQIRANQDVEKK